MSRTISTTLTSGITLVSGNSPVSITATGRITENTNDAVYGASGVSPSWTVTNAGTIVVGGASGIGVHLRSSGTIDAFTNQSGGLITSTHNGVVINDAGSVTNMANATITSSDTGLASAIYTEGLGTVLNAGLVQAGNIAVYELIGGSVTNLATGTIKGAGGVYLHGPGTVTNAGTIIGTNAAYGAVLFDSNASASRLIVDPGAVFTGKIISLTNSTNVIELASGASAGTLAGFNGSSITNFATLQFDSGAAWTVSGTSGASGLGSIAITGFAAGDTIDLTGFVAVSKTFASNALVLTNASNAHATLHVNGSFTSSSFSLAGDGATGTDIFLAAAPALAYGQTIDQAGIVATSETVDLGGTLTLFNSGNTVVGTIAVGTSLSTGDFLLAPDGSGGTDVIVSSVFGTYTAGVTLETNPSKIISTGKATNTATNGKAVSGPTGANWTLANYGLVSETASGGIGISFAQSGTITNAAGGRVTASGGGIVLTGGGVVTNASGGVINAYSGITAAGAATVVNAGQIIANETAGSASGVTLSAGGTVTNQADGTIAGDTGVRISGAAGLVVNLGSIAATYAPQGHDGVYLANGGKVVNGASGGAVSTANISGYNHGVAFGATGTDTVVNYGVVYGQGSAGVMINTGTVINGPGGATGAQLQAGGANAVVFNGSGTVFNYGTIQVRYGPGPYYGVLLSGGGIINNLGTRSLIEGQIGVYAQGNATVTNAGTIAENGGGIALKFGGTTNRLIVDPGAVFIGTVTAAGASTLELASAAATGTISGLGTQFTGFQQTTIDVNTQWVVNGGNSISTGTTLTNSGADTVTGTLANAGLITGAIRGAFLGTGGQITNQVGGVISATGATGVAVAGSGIGTLVNAGIVQGNTATGAGVSVALGGVVTNQSGGTISGQRAIVAQASGLTVVNAGSVAGGVGFGRSGVALNGSGTISNQSGGVITGHYAIAAYAAGATITNAGRISGVYAALLNGAGSLTNQSGGTISGSSEGVLANAVATVDNAGTITGVGYGVQLALGGTVIARSGGTISGTGTAVSFGASRTSRLVVYQGATFTGLVDGGNTPGAASISTLELTSAASIGTLSGLGSKYINFAQVTIDAGASWTLAGSNMVVAHATLSNSGTLIDSGVSGPQLAGGYLLNEAGGTITNSSGAAVIGVAGTAASVVNLGTIAGSGLAGYGIDFAGGGVSNGASTATSALITATSVGILIAGAAGTVTNAGTINTYGGNADNAGVYLKAGGSVTNQAGGSIHGYFGIEATTDTATVVNAGYIGNGSSIGAGVVLGNGGSVSNQSGGRIVGSLGVTAAVDATVVNDGYIGGNAFRTGRGVYFAAGGTITNQSLGTIASANYGVLGTGGVVTVVNSGTMTGYNAAVRLLAGGLVTNQTGGAISLGSGGVGIYDNSAPLSVLNAGLIGSDRASGVLMRAGGTITNQASGTIGGYPGIDGRNVAITVVNYGSIYGSSANGPSPDRGIYLGAGGSINNQSGGTITGYQAIFAAGVAATVVNAGSIGGVNVVGGSTYYGTGIILNAGGAITNQLGGTITAAGGEDILANGVAAVVNAGFLRAGGVRLQAGGSVTNQASGTIGNVLSGYYVGIVASGGAATVTNAGSVIASQGVNLQAGGTLINQSGGKIATYGAAEAVVFTSGYTSRVVVEPGAVFVGAVDGGNAIGATSISTLELASGASAGTLSGLGVNYLNFAQTTIDAGAAWTLSGTNTLVVGATLTIDGALNVAGTLTNSGSVVFGSAMTVTGTLVNSSSIVASSAATAVYVGSFGVVTNTASGTISGGKGIDGTGFAVRVVNAGLVSGASYGILLVAGGTITAQSGGQISGGTDAVKFGAGTTNRLVINPGATFTGTVDGGNPLGAPSTSTLELTSTASTGTFGGFGVNYINFGQVTVDAGASWTLTGTNALAARATLSNAGAITDSGTNGLRLTGGYVINLSGGTIANTVAGHAIDIATGGTVGNRAGATIAGESAIFAINSAAAVVNAGAIRGDLIDGSARGVRFGGGGGSVTNQLGGVISGYEAVFSNGYASVSNAGAITGNLINGIGLALNLGGNVTNQSGATITGYRGVYTGDIVTVVNAGSIGGGATASGGSGVYLLAGGSVTNQSGGTISGYNGIISRYVTAAVVNAGDIAGHSTTAGYGVWIRDGGSVTNQSGGTISGLTGVAFTGSVSGTLVDSGTIIGTGGTAVAFGASGNLLRLDPGALSIQGTVDGGGGPNTLEFASAASVGTLTGTGADFVHFGAGTVDAGASWVLAGDNTFESSVTLDNSGALTNSGTLVNSGTLATSGTLTNTGSLINDGTILLNAGTLTATTPGGTLGGTGTIAFGAGTGDVLVLGSAGVSGNVISSMVSGQTIEMSGKNFTAADVIGDTLHLSGDGTVDINLDPGQSYAGDFFHVATVGSDSFITEDSTPCYLAGTSIRTDRGEIAVEDLVIGDRVITFDGTAKPVRWIGHRAYTATFATANRDVIPIRIKQGALADNVPARDLFVSPLHAMFIDDVLIPAEHLVNGVSIDRCPHIDPIRYFHVELDQHDVIFAESAPAETFVDCDSRGMFHNAAEFRRLYPADRPAQWMFCAPRLDSGPILDRVRRRIDSRAGLRGADVNATPGRLMGQIDELNARCIRGWAFDPSQPKNPVILEVLDGQGLLCRIVANRLRPELATGGDNHGQCGFELRLASPLSPLVRHEITVRRASDGRDLHGSPVLIEPHDGPALVSGARDMLAAAALGGAGNPGELDALLDTLLHSIDQVRHIRAMHPADPANDTKLARLVKPEPQVRRALVIDDQQPRPDHDAGSNAILSHMAALRDLGWRVEFVASRELAGGHDAAALRGLGIECHHSPMVASVEEVLRRSEKNFGLIYLHRLSNAEAYAAMARAWQPKALLVYGVADLHHVRMARQAATEGDLQLLEASRRVKVREFNAMRMVDAVITHSPAEAAWLAREAPKAAVHVVPWAPTVRRSSASPFARRGVAFVGGMDHAPNQDAVRWLTEEIMPLVWKHDPRIPCLVVGSGWGRGIERARLDRRVNLIGRVAELDGLFNQVRLTVAPLRFGAGIKGKVVDSLAAGVPCVMSSVAAEGIPLTGVLLSAIADDPVNMAALICAIHDDPLLHAEHAAAGPALVRRHYGHEMVVAAMADAVGAVSVKLERDRGAA